VLEPGTKVGHYTLTAQIGAGGMGEVYATVMASRSISGLSKCETAVALQDLGRFPRRNA
jgi:hypothetical protein